jgi:hypothetical protein
MAGETDFIRRITDFFNKAVHYIHGDPNAPDFLITIPDTDSAP